MRDFLTRCLPPFIVLPLLVAVLSACVSVPKFEISPISLTPEKVVAGQDTLIRTTITNPDSTANQFTAVLKVNEKEIEKKVIRLEPGLQQELEFDYKPEAPGIYTIAIGNQTGNLTVVKPPDFRISQLLLDPPDPVSGMPFTVSATITNAGESEGTYYANLMIDETSRWTKDVLLSSGETKDLTFTIAEDKPGEHQIVLGNVAQSFTILSSEQYLLQNDNHSVGQGWTSYGQRGQWIKFSPPAKPFKLQKIYLEGSRTDFSNPENKFYTINIRDKTFSTLVYTNQYPFSKFSTQKTIVENEIDPALVINDDFYVEFISSSDVSTSGVLPPAQIFLDSDFSVIGNANSGFSFHNTFDTTTMEGALKQYPQFSGFSWLIQAGGIAQKVDSLSTLSQTGTKMTFNSQQIVASSMDAFSRAGTYKYESTTGMSFDVSGGNQPGVFSINSILTGIVDNSDKAMQLFMNITSDMPGNTPQNNTSSYYLLDGWEYAKIDQGDWTKTPLTDENWNAQNPMSTQKDLLISGNSNLLNIENVGGTDYYVIQINPGFNYLAGWLSNQSGYRTLNGLKTDLSQLIKQFSIKEWIAKDTFLPLKSQIDLTLQIQSSDLSVPSANSESVTMELNSETVYHDFNQPVSITGPPGAKTVV